MDIMPQKRTKLIIIPGQKRTHKYQVQLGYIKGCWQLYKTWLFREPLPWKGLKIKGTTCQLCNAVLPSLLSLKNLVMTRNCQSFSKVGFQ